jgi:hypothetical protein
VSAHGRDGIGATNPNDVRFLPLLFVVLAIAIRLAPEHIGGDARNRRVTSLRYYWSCEGVQQVHPSSSSTDFVNSTTVSLNCSRHTA